MMAVLVLTIATMMIDRFGVASIILTVAGALAIPTVTFGPPGIYKILELLVQGFLFDMILYLFGRRERVYIVAGAAVGVIAAPMILLFLVLLNLPGADKLAPLVTIFSVIYAIVGAIGAKIGLWIFEKKLKNRAFIRQLH